MNNKLGSNQFKTRKGMKNKKIVILFVSILVICFGIYAFKAINNWYNTHYFEFKAPVEVKLNQPVAIKTRIPKIIEKKIILDYPNDIDTPLEQYICDKFGLLDCKIALSVAQAESGMRENAYNHNTNNTIDIGIFQVNQIHWTKPGCSPKELFDAYKNVDCAYTIWKGSGWGAWVAYNTGSFLSKL